jgi:hypothetical protein
MASGDTLVVCSPLANEPPASAYASIDFRNGHPILNFDASAAESATWTAVLPRHYAGGGVTVLIIWAGASATSGNVVWNAQIERLESAGTDSDADSFASAQAATGAAQATNGALTYTTIPFTSGAQMDSLAAGELFRLKVTRDATNGSDTMTGDANCFGVEVRES